MNLKFHIYIQSHICKIFGFIPKKKNIWFGRNPSVRLHNRRENRAVFGCFLRFFFILPRFFYFLTYLNQFLWTFSKKTFYSQINFEHFFFLQLSKILLGWPGIRTDILRGQLARTFSWFSLYIQGDPTP